MCVWPISSWSYMDFIWTAHKAYLRFWAIAHTSVEINCLFKLDSGSDWLALHYCLSGAHVVFETLGSQLSSECKLAQLVIFCNRQPSIYSDCPRSKCNHTSWSNHTSSRAFECGVWLHLVIVNIRHQTQSDATDKRGARACAVAISGPTCIIL